MDIEHEGTGFPAWRSAGRKSRPRSPGHPCSSSDDLPLAKRRSFSTQGLASVSGRTGFGAVGETYRSPGLSKSENA
jgi:hypothetical protein